MIQRTPDAGHITHVNGEPLPEPIPVQAGDDLAFVIQDGQIGVSVTKGESTVSDIDKQLEAEATKLRAAYYGHTGLPWSAASPEGKADWLRVAARARELADARYRPLVEAVERFRDAVLHQRGNLEEPCLDNDQTNAVLAEFDDEIGRELDKVKGGGG